MLIVSSLDGAREIIKTHDTTDKHLYSLRNKRVRSFRSIREEEVALFMKIIERHSCSSSLPLNLSEMFALLSNDLIYNIVQISKLGRNSRSY